MIPMGQALSQAGEETEEVRLLRCTAARLSAATRSVVPADSEHRGLESGPENLTTLRAGRTQELNQRLEYERVDREQDRNERVFAEAEGAVPPLPVPAPHSPAYLAVTIHQAIFP